MAFNWKTFQTRTLTAIVFAAVMLIGLLWNQWSFLVLFSIIHFGCWWEYLNLVEKFHNTSYHRYIRIGFMLIGFALMLWFCGPEYKINNYHLKENFSFPVSIAGMVMLVMGIFQTKQIKLKALGIAALGLLYISLSWGLMVDLRNQGGIFLFGKYIRVLMPILIIATIWINDTMAYITGSLYGKHQLSKISPKKTWEGTISGIIIATILVGYVVGINTEDPLWTVVFTTPLIISIAGTFGDLLESKLKRMAGVKDSGNIMPGHGGFLDRFDSLLLATPAVWLYAYFLMR